MPMWFQEKLSVDESIDVSSESESASSSEAETDLESSGDKAGVTDQVSMQGSENRQSRRVLKFGCRILHRKSSMQLPSTCLSSTAPPSQSVVGELIKISIQLQCSQIGRRSAECVLAVEDSQ